jgi:hypothetical protein
MGGSWCLFMPAGDCEGYGEMGRIDWLVIDVMREIQLRRLVVYYLFSLVSRFLVPESATMRLRMDYFRPTCY